MKWLLLLLPLHVFGQQRDILYVPEDSTYLVPIERARILELKARSYEELLPAVDSLLVARELEQELLREEIAKLGQSIAEERRAYNLALAQQKKEPNFWERFGYTLTAGVVRFIIFSAISQYTND